MGDFVLSSRLGAAFKYVRQNAVFADVGTDHAFLPIALLKSGKIERAICSDINEGPLSSARKNAREQGVFDKIEFLLSDGARGLADKPFTDVAICGMGGELIRDIIKDAPHLKRGDVRLILQPMTKPKILRKFLYEAGFDILFEDYSSDAGKYYVTLVCEYRGGVIEASEVEMEIGKGETRVALNDAFYGYFRQKAASLQREIEGKTMGGLSADKEEELLRIINLILRGN